jgi:zinc/manganese transport system ATP-binding protein
MTEPLEIVSAKNLAAGYNKTAIWSDATFSIEKGEFIGLVGPNGAGKTTLFRLLLGLERPLSGSLQLFARKPHRGNPRIGYIPQRRLIDTESRLEAIEYVRLGITGNSWGFSLPARADKERCLALDALKAVDGEKFATRPLKELSGGEQQRVFLAQALVGKPELLLLDEPLANLDIRRENELVTLVKQVVVKEKIAALLIAHDINPLLPVVDRVMYVANGKVVTGAPHAVVTSKVLSELFDAPIEVLRDSRGRVAVLGVEEAVHHVG